MITFLLGYQDDFTGDGVDLYDDISGPTEVPTSNATATTANTNDSDSPNQTNVNHEAVSAGTGSNGIYHQGSANAAASSQARRFQLYVGNLTWVCLPI